MDCCNPSQTPIVRIQSGCYRRKPEHELARRKLFPIRAAEQMFDFALLAHDKAIAAPLD